MQMIRIYNEAQMTRIKISIRMVSGLRRMLFGILVCCHIGMLSFSCSNENDHLFKNDLVPAVFTPGIVGEIDGEVGTRVVNNTWSGTEVVGISSVGAGGNLATGATWYQYKASEGTSATLTPSGNVLYYPVDGSNVDFFAFSPYKEPNNTNQVVYSGRDQSTLANLEAVDFIWAKATGTYNKKNPNVSLAFAHKQSKMIIKVTADTSNGVTDTDMGTSNAMLSLTTMPLGLTYNLSDCSPHGGIATGTITPYKNTTLTTTTSVTWEAIVPPHAGTTYPSRKLNFTFNGKSYSYALPTADAYIAGYSYTYNLTLTTSGVVLQSSTVSNWTGGSASWNGGKHVLHATSNELNFYPTGTTQTLQIQYQGTTNAPVAKVSTSATSSTAGTVSWITATMATSATTSSPWTERTLTVVTTANTEITNRTGYIHISLEGLSVVIMVTQGGIVDQGDANCFIVAPGSTFSFDLSRAITYGGAPSSATFTVTKLWDDTSGGAITSVSVSGKTITVKAGNVPGNALIAAQVGGVTYWSWHIWVTGYNPNVSNWTNTYNTNKNGEYFVFMDRNLGATFAGTGAGYGTGLFYQWGRKDPFPATLNAGATQPGLGSFTAVATSATNGTIENTIKNPSVFYMGGGGTSGYDWYWGSTGNARTDRDDTLWGHGNTTAKSPYDPCPAGWRVPSHNVDATIIGNHTDSPWRGFSTSTGGEWLIGYRWGTHAAYPAAGYRFHNNSSITGSGTTGAMWSASPYYTALMYAAGLLITSTTIKYDNNNPIFSRSNGLSVRCVQT